MIKANTTKASPAVFTVRNGGNIPDIAPLLSFPINIDNIQKKQELGQMDRSIAEVETLIARRQTAVEDARKLKFNYLKRREELKKFFEENTVTTLNEDEVIEVLKEVTKLSWVGAAALSGTWLIINTRPGELKTTFDERIVYDDTGHSAREFMEPVALPLPTYRIDVNLLNMGNKWTLNNSALGIRLTDQEDTQYFVGGKIYIQEPHSHWASNERAGVGNGSHLCLGEYDDELKEESTKGLLPFLNALALYLQTSGDEHAYRSKLSWAIMLGKKEYGVCLRKMDGKETVKSIEEKYREDFKKYRQPQEKGLGVNMQDNMVVGANEMVEGGMQDMLLQAFRRDILNMPNAANRRARRAAMHEFVDEV